jgi:hypothetical protein
MTPETYSLEEIVEMARVPIANKSAALDWLNNWVEINPEIRKSKARSLFDAAHKRPVPSEFNPPLENVASAAGNLVAALHTLRLHPYAYYDFWLGNEDVFGPIHDGKYEREFMTAIELAMQKIEIAARSAMIDLPHRPSETGKRRIVELAAKFFQKFSTVPPSNGDVFRAFVVEFCKIILGKDFDGKSLDGQIKLVVKGLKGSLT